MSIAQVTDCAPTRNHLKAVAAKMEKPYVDRYLAEEFSKAGGTYNRGYLRSEKRRCTCFLKTFEYDKATHGACWVPGVPTYLGS